METSVGCSFSGCCSPHAGHVSGSGYHANPQPTPATRIAGAERERETMRWKGGTEWDGGREKRTMQLLSRGAHSRASARQLR